MKSDNTHQNNPPQDDQKKDGQQGSGDGGNAGQHGQKDSKGSQASNDQDDSSIKAYIPGDSEEKTTNDSNPKDLHGDIAHKSM